MKKVSIKPGCVACGACQFIVPQVFCVSDVSRVKKGVDLQKYDEAIKEAVAQCPVGVICYNQEVRSCKEESDVCERQDI